MRIIKIKTLYRISQKKTQVEQNLMKKKVVKTLKMKKINN
jgi:hypothetical protein